ncbi:MAG: hypothetical protein EOP86_13390 [Verrucomicrobiaceae bacterium]|nr:MAG: hypothetical protein EOP86_13390 [Verrucomicrobiaceae bacterium]
MDSCAQDPHSIGNSLLHYSWREVLGIPVLEVICGWNGVEGALCYDLGLVLENGVQLNLTNPLLPFRRDSTTRPAELIDDFTEEMVPLERITGRSLKSLIRAVNPDKDKAGHHNSTGHSPANVLGGGYYAVLDDNHYLTTYAGFNHTVFGYGSFSRENRGRECRNSWSHLIPSGQEYRNAWTGDRIAPFSVYW